MKRLDDTNWWPLLMLLFVILGTMAGTMAFLNLLVVEAKITCEQADDR